MVVLAHMPLTYLLSGETDRVIGFRVGGCITIERHDRHYGRAPSQIFTCRTPGSSLLHVAELADYLDLTVSQARRQFRELKPRSPVSSGRQAVFLPVETLLCLAVSFLVNHRRFGGSTAHQAPEPIPSLARLFSRPPSSILAKMANLDGSRSHGGKWDILAGAVLRDEPAHFTHIYRVLQHRGPGRGY